MKKRSLSARLKNRTRSCSAQAALTSVAIHLLLIIFAGSIVAVRYVQKQSAELIARTETRPKLERRPLQTPQKVEQLQKRALTSKLVSKKASFSNPEFVLPDTGTIGSLKTQKFALPGADAGRVLRNLSRMPGIGPSRINFFGLRAEGEKAVFIIDASSLMLEEKTGGFSTYEYIKEELVKLVSELNPSVLFNVIFHDQQRVFIFRPGMVPAARKNKAERAEWVPTVIPDPEQASLGDAQHNYLPQEAYDTAVGSDARGWLLALQAAMEQQPDTVLMLGPGWGSHRITPEKAQRLLDYAMWELLVGNVISSAPVLAPDRKLRDDLLRGAVEAIHNEEKLSEAKKIPAGYVRDIGQYVEYSKEQIFEHLDAVSQIAYTAHGFSKPYVHYVRLSEAGDMVVAGGAIQHLWALTGRYGGKLEFLRREAGRAGLAGSEAAWSDGVSRPASEVNFFGLEQRAARAVFILDVSDRMVREETGGLYIFDFIKKQIQTAVSALPPDILFNVFLYSGEQLALFKPQMVSPEPELIAELETWLAPVNSDPEQTGLPEEMRSTEPVRDYGTVIGADAFGWLRALQSAVEQQADAVFIAGEGWGAHPVSREKGRKLLDFSVWEAWGSGGGAGGGVVTEEVEEEDEEGELVVTTTVLGGASGSVGSPGALSGMQKDKQTRNDLLKEALAAIQKEDEIRKVKQLPQPFVRDILSYLRYPAAQISDHLNAVIKENSADEKPPVVHFVCLVPGEERPAPDVVRSLRRMTADYNGSLIVLRGAADGEEMKRLNRSLDFTGW